MELIWRLPSLGPPLSSGGREDRTADPGRRRGRERKAVEAEKGRQAGQQATDVYARPFGLILTEFMTL